MAKERWVEVPPPGNPQPRDRGRGSTIAVAGVGLLGFVVGMASGLGWLIAIVVGVVLAGLVSGAAGRLQSRSPVIYDPRSGRYYRKQRW